MKTRTIQRVDPVWLVKGIGANIRRERLKRKLTLDQVATAMGVTRAAVNNWELGYQDGFMVAVVYNLALFYRVPVGKILP